MRRYIFTEFERKLLEDWLAEELTVQDARMLDNTLDRVRMHKKGLLADIHLFIQALRKLNLERRFER